MSTSVFWWRLRQAEEWGEGRLYLLPSEFAIALRASGISAEKDRVGGGRSFVMCDVRVVEI
jgi:hypothetical protein